MPFLFTLLVYRQIRERFKRKVRTLFSSATDGNSTKKNLNVNLIDFVMWMQLNWSFVMSLNWKKNKKKKHAHPQPKKNWIKKTEN